MAKAIVKTKTGTVITIEGTHREVAEIVAEIEMRPAIEEKKRVISVEVAKKKEAKKRNAASDLIIELKEDGFFEKPKNLGAISHALESRGYIYPITTLSGVALGLVQRKLLGRKKVDGKWVYGK